MSNDSYGFTVRGKFTGNSPYGPESFEYHNVTEVHYHYPTVPNQKRIAFESDIHGTGITHEIAWIDSFEVTPATSKHSEF